MDFPWVDAESIIEVSLMAWRAAFPAAHAVNLMGPNPSDPGPGGRGRCVPIVDAIFVYIRGDERARLLTVKMTHCFMITDAAFCAPARDPISLHGQLLSDHGRGLRAPKWNTIGRRELVQSGDHHGRCLRAATRDAHAQHGRMQSGAHHGRCLCCTCVGSIRST